MENEKIKELAEFLGCDEEDITVSNWNNRVFELGNKEYLVVTDEEADEEATSRIEEDIWAFSAKFILETCGIDYNAAVISSLKEMQERCCESCNPFFLSLIEGTCGIAESYRKPYLATVAGTFWQAMTGASTRRIAITSIG